MIFLDNLHVFGNLSSAFDETKIILMGHSIGGKFRRAEYNNNRPPIHFIISTLSSNTPEITLGPTVAMIP